MPYTTHGHWFGPGEPTQPGPRSVAKCMGTHGCPVCRAETEAGHSYQVSAGIRDLPPVDEWVRRELTGDGWMRCECGIQISGPLTEVKRLAAAHREATV